MKLNLNGTLDGTISVEPYDREPGDVGSLNDLDDVDTTGVANNSIIKYNSSSGNFEISTDSGIALSDLSVTQASASGTGTLAYNNSTGVFTYTPPDLSSFGGLSDVVDDTTPQLGGDLDLNGNKVTHTGGIIFERSSTNENSGVVIASKNVGSGGDLTHRVPYFFNITDETDSHTFANIHARREGTSERYVTISTFNDDTTNRKDVLEVFRDSSDNYGVTIDGTLAVTADTTDDALLLTTTEASSTAAPVLTFKRNSASPADGDYIGQLKFKGENDADQEVVYAKMTGKISDATDTTEDGLLEFALRKAGSNNIGMRLTSTELKLLNGTSFDIADGTITTAGPTGSGDVISATADLTGSSGGAANAADVMSITKKHSTSSRLSNLKFKSADSSNTYHNHSIASRRNGTSVDDKFFHIYEHDDAGTAQPTELVRFKKNSAFTSTNNLVEMRMNGRIDLTIGDADDMPNSNITTVNMDGTTSTNHNILTGKMDFGGSSISDGAQVQFVGDALNDADGEKRIGSLIFAYGTDEKDNTIEMRVANHDLSIQSSLKVDGEQAGSSVPFKVPAYTVANLPTSGIDQGAMAIVTNANTADVSTGIAHCFYDGANWKYTHLPATTVRT